LTIQQDSVFVGGRYMKLQRNISHTPWEVDGVRKTDLAVSELIAAPLEVLVRSAGRLNATHTE
jgi:tRNA pseudouridine synthase 10